MNLIGIKSLTQEAPYQAGPRSVIEIVRVSALELLLERAIEQNPLVDLRKDLVDRRLCHTGADAKLLDALENSPPPAVSDRAFQPRSRNCHTAVVERPIFRKPCERVVDVSFSELPAGEPRPQLRRRQLAARQQRQRGGSRGAAAGAAGVRS
jgi:hypothetical protein